jgi:SAM-dependent methyltransferase
MENDSSYYDKKWRKVISELPIGGDYRFDLRSHGYGIICEYIGTGKHLFDFACGVGVFGDVYLKAKGGYVAGCDFSQVAVDHCRANGQDATQGSQITVNPKRPDGKYDYVVANYFLEHIKNPVEWINDSLYMADAVICSIPNNFNKHGEHVDMQWGSFDEFNELFSVFVVERIDDGKYPSKLHKQFQHPIFVFRRA